MENNVEIFNQLSANEDPVSFYNSTMPLDHDTSKIRKYAQTPNKNSAKNDFLNKQFSQTTNFNNFSQPNTQAQFYMDENFVDSIKASFLQIGDKSYSNINNTNNLQASN